MPIHARRLPLTHMFAGRKIPPDGMLHGVAQVKCVLHRVSHTLHSQTQEAAAAASLTAHSQKRESDPVSPEVSLPGQITDALWPFVPTSCKYEASGDPAPLAYQNSCF